MAKRGYKLQELVAHTSDVKCLNIGKKSCRVFVTGGEDRKVNLWAIGKPTSLLSLSGHTSPVESVTFDSSEALLLAGASSGTIKLWDLEDTKTVRTLTGHRSKCTSLEFHPFGEFFASGSIDADLKIWDIRKKGCIHTYKGHTQGINAIRFTPDGRWVVSGGEDNIVKVWDLTAGKLLHDFKFHNGAIRSLDFHPHEFLLATGSADRTVNFWDLETFELIGSAGPEVTGVRSIIFHPDGKTLFCGLDKSLKVFSWEPIRCHDDVNIGWSTLGDLSIYEGKLLGCSYHQSCVGVWVVDLSLIGPYSAGAFPRPNGYAESVFKSEENLTSLNSFQACLNASEDQEIDTKEIIHTECNTSDESKKSFGRVGSIKASKGNARSSALLRGTKGPSSYSGTQTIETTPAAKSSMPRSTSSRESVATENRPSEMKTNGLYSKGSPLSTSAFSGNGLSNLKKDFMVDTRRGNNVQIVSKTICTPVVISRDKPDLLNSAKFQKKTSLPETESPDPVIYKTTHTRRSSYVDSGIESPLLVTESGLSGGASNDVDDFGGSNFLRRLDDDRKTESSKGYNKNIRTATELFQKVVFLDRSFSSSHDRSQEAPCSTSESNPVKYVKGVSVQHGRTRSLVESWEKRERFNNSSGATTNISSDPAPESSNQSLNLQGPNQGSERNLSSENGYMIPDSLMQNRDLFINTLKSRLTKLQMVRLCWEQTGIKGAINSVAKLPDHSVQVDVISVLIEKTDIFTLDLFSCLLPMLAGLLSSKTERHIDISLEMLLKLVKIFGPVVHSTMSRFSVVGVDIQAEQRLDRCRQVFMQFENIKEILPQLIRNGGSVARRALELNLFLQN